MTDLVEAAVTAIPRLSQRRAEEQTLVVRRLMKAKFWLRQWCDSRAHSNTLKAQPFLRVSHPTTPSPQMPISQAIPSEKQKLGCAKLLSGQIVQSLPLFDLLIGESRVVNGSRLDATGHERRNPNNQQ